MHFPDLDQQIPAQHRQHLGNQRHTLQVVSGTLQLCDLSLCHSRLRLLADLTGCCSMCLVEQHAIHRLKAGGVGQVAPDGGWPAKMLRAWRKRLKLNHSVEPSHLL